MAGLGIVKKSKTTVTRAELVRRFPAKKNTLTDELVDLINDVNNDPEFNGDEFLENMMTYQSVMHKNSGSLYEYINALKFCAYLEADVSNYTEAYKKARANDDFVIERMNAATDSIGYKELTTAASRFRKTPMVRDILMQAELPLYLMFQGGRYKAAGVLMEEMELAQFSKDRISAAKAFLELIKPPENLKIELDIGVKQDSVIDRYENMITGLIEHQKRELADGKDLHEITNISIIKSEAVIDVDDYDISADEKGGL